MSLMISIDNNKRIRNIDLLELDTQLLFKTDVKSEAK